MPDQTETKPARRHLCAYCGDDMGPWDKNSRSDDTCGKRECERWAGDNAQAEREEAHERLDRDMDW
jgi:hypothetical protein